ncbi:MAG: hypothetical protein AAGF23_16055, partial [Acidobacteriota bacterium]
MNGESVVVTVGEQPPSAGSEDRTVVGVAQVPFGGDFDRVILDLPCSGTGTLRKHPELKWRISPGEIGRL